jgi:16S rRNA (guanine966-N2)-methyltransferase
MTKSKSNIRIIGGKWRSRKVSFIADDTIRPTPDRVRETLFNWLAPYIVDSRCLDLYAGSGVLGLEALSRGAEEVLSVEQAPAHATEIKANAENLQAQNFTVYNAECLQWLNQSHPKSIDIVFVDPPYREQLLNKTFAALENKQWLKPGSLVYFEMDQPIALELLPATWKIWRESKAGNVLYFLCKKEQ